MFSLIQWDQDKSVSTIEKSLIAGVNKEGGKVSVKYGGRKKYSGIVLRMSDDKDWLESLKVTTHGKIIPQEKLGMSAEVWAKKSELTSAGRVVEAGKKTSSKRRQDDLIQLMTKQHAENATEESKDIDESGLPAKEVSEDSEESGLPLTSSALPAATTDCTLCTNFPQASASNLIYFNQIAAYVTSHHERTLRSTTVSEDNEKDSNCQRELLEMAHCMTATKVELSPGSGVYVSKDFICDLKRDFKKKPKEMVRRLFKSLVGVKHLLQCSALGETSLPAVPKDVKDAIQDWVGRNSSRDCVLTTSQFNRCINLMCGTLRHLSKPGQSKKSSKTTKDSAVNMSSEVQGDTDKPDEQITSNKEADLVSNVRREATNLNTPKKNTPIKTKESDVVATSPMWNVQPMNSSTNADMAKRTLAFDGSSSRNQLTYVGPVTSQHKPGTQDVPPFHSASSQYSAPWGHHAFDGPSCSNQLTYVGPVTSQHKPGTQDVPPFHSASSQYSAPWGHHEPRYHQDYNLQDRHWDSSLRDNVPQCINPQFSSLNQPLNHQSYQSL